MTTTETTKQLRRSNRTKTGRIPYPIELHGVGETVIHRHKKGIISNVTRNPDSSVTYDVEFSDKSTLAFDHTAIGAMVYEAPKVGSSLNHKRKKTGETIARKQGGKATKRTTTARPIKHIKATSRQSNNENKDPIVLSDSSDEENSLHRHEATAFSSNLRRENLLLQEMLNTRIQELQEIKSSKRLIEDSLQSALSNHKKQEKCIEELNAELKEAKVAISKSEDATENGLREITVLSETTEKLQATVDQLSVELCSSKEETIEAKHTATGSMEALARANSENDKATSEIASLRRKLCDLTEELKVSLNATFKAESRAFELYDKHTKLQKTTTKVTKERDELKVALDREKALNDALASKVTTTSDEPKECTEGSRASTVSSDPDSVARVLGSNTVRGDGPKDSNVDMDHHQGQKKKKD